MKVSVLMITYNHGNYIAQAVNSVLMQETNFDYELVIGEDCSTDNTCEILVGLAARYPEKIKLLNTEKNLGPNQNFVRTFKACKGQYISLLEGDDFWTVPHKLQKQADFLDNHPDCVVCFSNTAVVSEDGGATLKLAERPGQKEISTIEDLVQQNFSVTCSVMFRSGYVNEFPDWWFRLTNTDWMLQIFLVEYGKIGYIPEVMAAHRKHPDGIWTRLDDIELLKARTMGYEAINRHLDYRYDNLIRPYLSKHWENLAVELAERGYQLARQDEKIENVLTIFDHWPEDLPLTDCWKNGILARSYERLMVESYQEGNLPVTRYCCRKLIQYRPSRFKSRFILTIYLKSHLKKWI